MKLNTLLLTSAATLMVTSVAFAADLPSKKAAPAGGAVQICTIGGMKGFTIPDTGVCLDIGGRVTADFGYDLDAKSDDNKLDWAAWGANYRVHFDARSNSEIGVVRSFIEIEGGATHKAYIQFAGLTAGIKDSLTDVYGTSGNNPTLSGNPTTGIDYSIAAGGLTFAIGAENPLNNNVEDASGDRPDLIVALGGKAGPIGFKVAAVSHESAIVDGVNSVATYNGYAIKGAVNAALGSFNVIGFGGIADGASAYLGGYEGTTGAHYGANVVDFDGIDSSESSVYGAEINTTIGKTLVAIEAARYENKLDGATDTTDEFDVYVSHTLAKGLTIQPEYTYYKHDFDGTESDSSELLVRIQRDF